MGKQKLKYVGAKPIVSGRGVSFDQSKPDRYTFLTPALELLEALNFDATKDDKSVYLYDVHEKEYSSSELVDLLTKHCPNLDDVFAAREEKTTALIKKYTDRVKANETLSGDERRAWLGNIDIMRDYYLQYVTNESAYQCALDALAGKIHDQKIENVTFTMGKNYGLVFSHLIQVLTDHKPPYDATLSVEEQKGATVGKLDMNRSKPLSM